MSVNQIQLLGYAIPPLCSLCWSQKSGWLYLGNEKSYQRSAGVKTTRFSITSKVFMNILDFYVGVWEELQGPKGGLKGLNEA